MSARQTETPPDTDKRSAGWNAHLHGGGARWCTDCGTSSCRAVIHAPFPIGYSPIHIRQWLAPYPHAATSALFHDTETTTATNSEAAQALSVILDAPDDAQRRILLHGYIIDALRAVLNAPEQPITPATSRVMLSLDSLGAIQLRLHLLPSLGLGLRLTIDTAVLWARPTRPESPTGFSSSWATRPRPERKDDHPP
ncbi:acyl carrier protein [Streptomyces sp. NPDC056387]|uniref:acyl carrier protein n=1 Tax=Streptomyces sp. NPDC056387 TaxID=3345803 RepID=UPI0035E167E9